VNKRSYVVISPVRDEGKHLAGTIECMAAQSIRPLLWVIVNDGSTDNTGPIADEAARRHDWIRVIHRENRGFRKSGGGVIEAFNEGLRAIPADGWEYMVKFDGDLTFAPDYFERCFQAFERDSRLGLTSGTVCTAASGGTEEESKGDPPFHVRGASKLYRRACWQAIGGLLVAPGWDTLDEVHANMVGWRSYTLRDVRITHHRPTGGADGAWKDHVKNGMANYMVGYHPLFMVAKCMMRAVRRPYVKGGLGLFWGFLSGYLTRRQPVQNPDLIRYLRGQQLRRLFLKPSIYGE
jgi:glycosyltransferase involved in cell wall biosynthesis